MVQADSDGSVRLRRTHSVNRAHEISAEQRRERRKQPDRPVHNPSDSLLSSSSGYGDYRGLLNLCIILLVLSNGRVALENVIKYGILVDPIQWFQIASAEPLYWPTILNLASAVFILFCFSIEKLLSWGYLSEKMGLFLNWVNLLSILVFPAAVVSVMSKMHPIGASVVLSVYTVTFLKLVSYVDVNKWCRESYNNEKGQSKRLRTKSHSKPKNEASSDNEMAYKDKSITNGKLVEVLITYPDNLNLKDLSYFLLAPTLCYELNFPRTARIRKRFLINRIIEMFFLIQLMLALIQQWIVPTIRNSMTPFQQMALPRMAERLLKLSIPNHFIWLLFFYWFFHSVMNFLGEILRFSDREFYKDWWNAETVQYFWQNWNIPVHRWCVRHLYIPLVRIGCGNHRASVVVFLISAFFHEYLVSVPLRMFRLWAFMGMIAQIPLAFFVKRFLTGKLANMAMWLSLIIGQPLAILMYYHDYYVINYGTDSTNSTIGLS